MLDEDSRMVDEQFIDAKRRGEQEEEEEEERETCDSDEMNHVEAIIQRLTVRRWERKIKW